GKSGGARTLLAYKVGGKAFFVYGFAKNVRGNVTVHSRPLFYSQ
ncbi:MAG: type II toxin-antitoxin system RelE/ParE family toxin, partial [Gammaproteobacteria bacterium]|nr:type II toxin-antitoxin system RelE/ParE family toxin [Gammaproteobacteria bacterium]